MNFCKICIFVFTFQILTPFPAFANTVILTMDSSPNVGGVCNPDIGSHTVTAGETISINAVPVEGFYFSHWSVEGEATIADPGSSNTTVDLIDDATVTANFTQMNLISRLNLTTETVPAEIGVVIPEVGTVEVEKNTTVNISAMAPSEYLFSRWRISQGDCVIQNDRMPETTVTLQTDSTIVAEFYSNAIIEPSDERLQFKYIIKDNHIPDLVLTDLGSSMYFEGTLMKNTADISVYIGMFVFPAREKYRSDRIIVQESCQYAQLVYDKNSLAVSIGTVSLNSKRRDKEYDATTEELETIDYFDEKEERLETKYSYLISLHQFSPNSFNGNLCQSDYKYGYISDRFVIFTVKEDAQNLFSGIYIEEQLLSSNSTDALFYPNQNKTYPVGALFPLTGGFSSEGQAYASAVLLAAQHANDYFTRMGIDAQIDVSVYDTQSNAAVAYQGLEKCIQNGCKIVIGPALSSSTSILLSRANDSNTLLISPTSTAAQLAIANDNLMRLMYDDTIQSQAMSDTIIQDGNQHLLILTRGDLYGRGLANRVQNEFRARGGSVIGLYYLDVELSYPEILEDLQLIIEQNQMDSTAVLLISLEEGIDILQDAAEYDILRNLRWFGCDGLAQNADLIGNATAAEFAAETQFTCSTVTLPETDESDAILDELYNQLGYLPSSYAILAYDSMMLAAMSLQQSEGASITAIKQAIESEANHEQCVTTPILFNTTGDRSGGAYDFWQIQPGNQTYLWKRVSSWTENNHSGVELWMVF